MLARRVDFKFLKRLARAKIALLRQAEQEPRVVRGINALKDSLKLLDGCTGMGFRITLKPKSVRSARRRAGKRPGRA